MVPTDAESNFASSSTFSNVQTCCASPRVWGVERRLTGQHIHGTQSSALTVSQKFCNIYGRLDEENKSVLQKISLLRCWMIVFLLMAKGGVRGTWGPILSSPLYFHRFRCPFYTEPHVFASENEESFLWELSKTISLIGSIAATVVIVGSSYDWVDLELGSQVSMAKTSEENCSVSFPSLLFDRFRSIEEGRRLLAETVASERYWRNCSREVTVERQISNDGCFRSDARLTAAPLATDRGSAFFAKFLQKPDELSIRYFSRALAAFLRCSLAWFGPSPSENEVVFHKCEWHHWTDRESIWIDVQRLVQPDLFVDLPIKSRDEPFIRVFSRLTQLIEQRQKDMIFSSDYLSDRHFSRNSRAHQCPCWRVSERIRSISPIEEFICSTLNQYREEDLRSTERIPIKQGFFRCVSQIESRERMTVCELKSFRTDSCASRAFLVTSGHGQLTVP